MSNITEREKTKRKFDKLGRIVIPKKIRESLKMEVGGRMGISLKEDSIIIKKDDENILIRNGFRIRKMDNLGRIDIPIELRNILNIRTNDMVEIKEYKKAVLVNKISVC